LLIAKGTPEEIEQFVAHSKSNQEHPLVGWLPGIGLLARQQQVMIIEERNAVARIQPWKTSASTDIEC
jgi:hypothetical protein